MFAVYLTFQLKVFDFDLIALNFTPVTKQSIKLKEGETHLYLQLHIAYSTQW